MANDPTQFGILLRKLREAASLSVRQAAKNARISSAYLSQIETGKRGKRKGGAFFAPHPDILRKLAEAYKISPALLFDAAGYFKDGGEHLGFSEEQEIRRVFNFVTHDPALPDILSIQDMRAIIERYQAVTKKKLLTWAGDTGPISTRTNFQMLHLKDGILHSDSRPMLLTFEEAAQELNCKVAGVEQLILKHYLGVIKDSDGQLKIERDDLRKLKNYLVKIGVTADPINFHLGDIKPATPEEQKIIEEKALTQFPSKHFREMRLSMEENNKLQKFTLVDKLMFALIEKFG